MSKVSFNSSSRLFHLVFYPDSTSYYATSVLDQLVVSVVDSDSLPFLDKWAYILHDKDEEDGVLKKSHYHLVLSCKYPVRYSQILKVFDLPESSMTLPDANSKSRTYRMMVRYLVHADSPKKFQYSLDEIKSNFDITSYFDSVSSDTASSAFVELLDFLSRPDTTRRSMALYAASCGLIGYYRQYYRILWDIREYEEFKAYRANLDNINT